MKHLVLLGFVAVIVLAFGWCAVHAIKKERAKEHPAQNFIIKNDSACCHTTYLEYKADGTVWALWPDGRFIQVIPAK